MKRQPLGRICLLKNKLEIVNSADTTEMIIDCIAALSIDEDDFKTMFFNVMDLHISQPDNRTHTEYTGKFLHLSCVSSNHRSVPYTLRTH
jgi:hypothetical protein